MASPDAYADVWRDDGGISKGSQWEGEIQQMDGQRGIPKIVCMPLPILAIY
jgi:hypothetical protein